MTNDKRQPDPTTTTDSRQPDPTPTPTPTPTTVRRTRRAVTVAAGAACALLLWAVNDPWAGIDLTVRQGDATRHVGPVAVVGAALAAGLAA